MASSADSAAAAAAAAAAASDTNDGPVMSLMNKRLRALRKKYNRILQTEEAVAQGKPLNKEQEELLRSKPTVSLIIDEYDKLRLPLSAAVAEEISAARSAPESGCPSSSDSSCAPAGAGIEDLLRLLYFGSLFEVKPQSEFASTMLTRTHERECCLTYDYVTDEATDLLGERDLDSISALGGLLTSRPLYSTLSHKDALQSCLEHARRWLSNSNEPVLPGADVTYAGLRVRLNKILSSDYFTTAPEMKATEYVAAAAGKYSVGQTVVPDHGALQSSAQEEGEGDGYYHEKEEEDTDFQVTEPLVDQSTVEGSSNVDQSGTLYSEEDHSAHEDQYKLQADTSELNENEGAGTKGYAPRRGYYNQRGGGRGNGSGRRDYPNGRGGRGGRGSGGGNYQNGRNQSYDYYQRGYYNQKSRGGRSGGMGMYGNQGGANYVGHHVSPAEVMENRS